MTKTAATELGREAAERARASLDATEFGRRARDAAYTLVGLGVMGAQRANAATRDAARKIGREDVSIDLDALRAKTKDLSSVARRQLTMADEVVGGALARIEEALSPLEVRLPGAARETVGRVREAGKELHAQVRAIVAGEQPATSTATSTSTASSTHKAKDKAATAPDEGDPAS